MVRFPEAERAWPELRERHEVLDSFGSTAETHGLARVGLDDIEYPIHGIVVGAERADAPILALTGGLAGWHSVRSATARRHFTHAIFA